jgi:sodium-coupled neutral amino acid transporter 11
MVVILFTVVTQGILVPSSARGSFNTPLLTINNGVFQAIGVISFGAFLKRKESSPFR